jgi:hypothetical protein
LAPWQVGFAIVLLSNVWPALYCEIERPTFPTFRQLRVELRQEMMMCATAV